MKVARQQALGVGPYQRGEARRGQANGFKSKQLKTRVGPLILRVPLPPQVQGEGQRPHDRIQDRRDLQRDQNQIQNLRGQAGGHKRASL
jgi:Transposase, Mutator family